MKFSETPSSLKYFFFVVVFEIVCEVDKYKIPSCLTLLYIFLTYNQAHATFYCRAFHNTLWDNIRYNFLSALNRANVTKLHFIFPCPFHVSFFRRTIIIQNITERNELTNSRVCHSFNFFLHIVIVRQ